MIDGRLRWGGRAIIIDVKNNQEKGKKKNRNGPSVPDKNKPEIRSATSCYTYSPPCLLGPKTPQLRAQKNPLVPSKAGRLLAEDGGKKRYLRMNL